MIILPGDIIAFTVLYYQFQKLKIYWILCIFIGTDFYD